MKDITCRKELVAVVNELKHRLKSSYAFRDPMAQDLNTHLNKFIDRWQLNWDPHVFAKLPPEVDGLPLINDFVRVSADYPEVPLQGLIGRVLKYGPGPEHYVMLHNAVHWFPKEALTVVPDEEWQRWESAFS